MLLSDVTSMRVGAQAVTAAYLGSRAVWSGGGPAPWSPAALFAAGEKGLWLDPSDSATVFQDSAGTIPAAIGDPVGLILDKSGNSRHAMQTTTTKRPILMQESGRTFLYFDGVDDCLVSAALSFGVTSKASGVFGVRRDWNSAGILAELTENAGTNGGSFFVYAPGSVSNQFRTGLYLAIPSRVTATAAAFPKTDILSVSLDKTGADSAGQIAMRVNGVVDSVANVAGADTSAGGQFVTASLYIGQRGATTLPFKGRVYGMLMRGAATSSENFALAEAWMNSKTGAY